MIKVLVADDFAIVRVLLRQVLEMASDLQVVAMASNGQEAVDEAVIHCPHVAVMDVSMPALDGIEAARQIRVRCPKTRVLMISSYNTPQHIHHAIEAGALGYMLKEDLKRDLVTAIRTLHAGRRYFSKQISELARFYIDGDTRTKTDPEAARSSSELKNTKGDIPLLFILCVISANLFF
jgi:DNA-binding NarL/FixJ family response regulator